jgi:hypothetical protein
MTTCLHRLPFNYIAAIVFLLPVAMFAVYISFLVVPIVLREVVPAVVRAVVTG